MKQVTNTELEQLIRTWYLRAVFASDPEHGKIELEEGSFYELVDLFQSHEESKWNHIPTHPCLCSICLDARNKELRRVKQDIFKKVVTRFEICLGRFQACEEDHPDTHRVSLIEIPGWIEEFRVSLKALEEEEIK